MSRKIPLGPSTVRNQLKDQVNCFFYHSGFNPATPRLVSHALVTSLSRSNFIRRHGENLCTNHPRLRFSTKSALLKICDDSNLLGCAKLPTNCDRI